MFGAALRGAFDQHLPRTAPTSDASRRCNAASPVARNRLARCLIAFPRTCGMRAAGVPGRGE